MLSEHNEQNDGGSENVNTCSRIRALSVNFRSHVALSTKLSPAETRTITSLDGGSKTKVSNFEIELFVVQEIFRFQISMSNTIVMDIVQTINQLSEIEAADSLIESSTGGNVIKELTTSGKF